MLTRLRISNIALIDKSDITFDAGFSVLTGETGAGKSILIESVSFVLGDRASRENIRTGASKASVEAEFVLQKDSAALTYLKERELDDGATLVLYRELSVGGRNVCRINGTLVSAGELKQLGDLLVDLHGQHAHQSLLNSDTHLSLLDGFAGIEKDGTLAELATAREAALYARSELNQLKMNLQERMRRIDSLQFQADEIDRVQPVDGEEEELESLRLRMRHAETIQDGLRKAYSALYSDGGALSTVSDAREALNRIHTFDTEYASMEGAAEEAYYALEDVSYRLRDALNGFRFDPDALEEAETRWNRLQMLKRKYGATLREVLDYREKIGQELYLLENSEQSLAELETKAEHLAKVFENIALSVSERRKTAAKLLCSTAAAHLADMGMANAKLELQFSKISSEQLHENGIDSVEFYLSANRGEPLKPLTKVASGGEVSRIMLALKVAASNADRIETLVFDEVDTGISGMVANAVAKKMRELGKVHQVLCVTHLPQIAAHADHQYVAYKYSDDEQTHSITRRLLEEERTAEIARIMGSDPKDTAAMEHAAMLLQSAKEN